MMLASIWYRVAADVVLAIHAGFVLFVVAGLTLVLIGGARGWSWVRNPRFRLGHLIASGTTRSSERASRSHVSR